MDNILRLNISLRKNCAGNKTPRKFCKQAGIEGNKATSKLASTDDGTSTKSFRFLSGRMTLLIPYRCAANICERYT